MAWVRIDDQFTEHPKLVEAGPLAVAMQMAGLCYANRQLTDGLLPRKIVARFMPSVCFDPETGEEITWKDVARRLVEIGVWDEVDEGYLIHDYLEYQPSRAEVEAEREAARQRMAELRAKRKQNKERGSERSSEDVRPNNSRSSSCPNPDPNPLKSHDDTHACAREDDPEWRELTLAVLGATYDEFAAQSIEQDCEDIGVDAVKEAMRRSVERATGNRLSYYRKIVKGWRGKVKSLDDVRRLDEAARADSRSPPRRKSSLELAAEAKRGGCR